MMTILYMVATQRTQQNCPIGEVDACIDAGNTHTRSMQENMQLRLENLYCSYTFWATFHFLLCNPKGIGLQKLTHSDCTARSHGRRKKWSRYEARD